MLMMRQLLHTLRGYRMASKSKSKEITNGKPERQAPYTIACLPSERAKWVAAARKIDRPLSWWVRQVCNAAAAAEVARQGEANAALSN